MEGERYVTVAEAIDLLSEMSVGIEGDQFVFELDGERFDEGESDTIDVRVNDESVGPEAYVLEHGITSSSR